VQRALQINTLQLMLKQMPLSTALLLPVIVLAEDVTSGSQPLVSLVFTPQLLGVIVLTAVMAFFVNVSTFYIIAELSAIRSPSCLTLLQLQRAGPLQDMRHHRRRRFHVPRGGTRRCRCSRPTSCLFSQTFDLQKAGGACCCIVGAFCYARLNHKQPAPAAAVSLDDVNGSGAGGRGKGS
jgi:hypothetical protein